MSLASHSDLPIPPGEQLASLRALVASMAEGVVLQQADGRITTANPAALRLLGLTQEQLEGRSSLDPTWRTVRDDGSPFPGEQHPAMVALATGRPVSNVLMGVYKPDGSLTWISISAEPIRRDGVGTAHAVVTTFVDVTERVVRNRTLMGALEGPGQGSYEVDLRTGVVTFSESWAAMFGYAGAELASTMATCERLLHPDDASAARSAFEAFLRGETPHYQAEERMLHKDGRWIATTVRGNIVERDVAGAATRFAGMYTDVSAHKQVEAALRAKIADDETTVNGLRDALANVRTLEGVLPICMHCKRIRDEVQRWHAPEIYIRNHIGTRFSHGLCPDCEQLHYPEEDFDALVMDSPDIAAKRARREGPFAGLSGFCAALGQAASVADCAAIILSAGLHAVGGGSGMVLLAVENGASLQVVSEAGGPTAAVRFGKRLRALGFDAPVTDGAQRFSLQSVSPLCDACRSGSPVWLQSHGDMRARYPDLTADLVAGGYRAVAAIPLVSRGRLIGALRLSFEEARTFDQDERQYLHIFTEQCALALDRAMLLGRLPGA